MKVIAVCNLKGGVGKTTTAVNLSSLAAASGQRVLLWDLDPQAAASFALRVRPRVEGLNRKSIGFGSAFSESIKETDYANLHLLPADFAYRKLDRFLDQIGKPRRVLRTLLTTIGHGFDVVFLDCPAGASLMTEGILAAADAILAPTLPTVLSLRPLVRLMKLADCARSTARLAAFFTMVDRRKSLHRHACDFSRDYPAVFLAGRIPAANSVEQMAVRRMPLAAFAPRDAAAAAFGELWTEFQSRLLERRAEPAAPQNSWKARRLDVKALMARLESREGRETAPMHRAPAGEMRETPCAAPDLVLCEDQARNRFQKIG